MEKGTEFRLPLLHEDGLETQFDRERLRRSQQKTVLIWCWIGQIVCFLASIGVLATAWNVNNSGIRCVEKLSPFSPALAAIDDEYQNIRFNGTVTGSSYYKGRPTKERAYAWEELWRVHGFSIDHDTLLKIGAPESSAKFPEHLGGGYVAMLEVYHQIHCVEELWKNTWPEFYHPHAGDEDALYRQHLDHCADIIRQKIACDGDVSVITFNWVKHMSHITPNFNTVQKCRNLDAIDAWAWKHQVNFTEEEFPKPHDAQELEDLP